MFQFLFPPKDSYNFKSISFIDSWSKVEGSNPLFIANLDQKTILIEKAYEEIKEICTKFQDESGASDMEIKTLSRELSRVLEKEN